MDNIGSHNTSRYRARRLRLARRGLAAGSLALVLGAIAGAGFVVVAGPAVGSRTASPGRVLLDATHVAPLLTTAGEQVELRYDLYCVPESESAVDRACDARGSVFVRPAGSGPFAEISLRIDSGAQEGRHRAVVPSSLVRNRRGFEYYAVFRSDVVEESVTLPVGGASAPHRSVPLGRVVEVDLGTHRFGVVRPADARVARASWGDAPSEAGLEQGRNLPPIGASSFDVGEDRTIHLLDEAHRRLLRWTPGSLAPSVVPLAIDGTLADLAVARDGTAYVLEGAAAGRNPLLRVFERTGRPVGAAETAERTASQVRLSADDAVVLQQPSGQWMAAGRSGRPLPATAQLASARSGRTVPGQGEVVLLRTGNEIRAAVVSEGGAMSGWRVASTTPLAEVQLAEPAGKGLVVVARVHTDAASEFVVLVLGPGGLVQRFSLAANDWAETAPLSRFRLRGASLYQLGSTPEGVFVDRFDLELS